MMMVMMIMVMMVMMMIWMLLMVEMMKRCCISIQMQQNSPTSCFKYWGIGTNGHDLPRSKQSLIFMGRNVGFLLCFSDKTEGGDDDI